MNYPNRKLGLFDCCSNITTNHFSALREIDKLFKIVFGEYYVITLSGKQHQRQRQLLTPPFDGERMRNYTQVINNLTEEVMNESQIDKSFSVRDITQAITLKDGACISNKYGSYR